MDRSTHEIRLANWKAVVEQCNSRPPGVSVKQWLSENNINEKTYYYWLRRVRREVYSQMQQELSVLQEAKVPTVAFAEIPVPDTCKTEDISFKADVVIRSGSLVISVANSVSESLLSKVLEGVSHAC